MTDQTDGIALRLGTSLVRHRLTSAFSVLSERSAAALGNSDDTSPSGSTSSDSGDRRNPTRVSTALSIFRMIRSAH